MAGTEEGPSRIHEAGFVFRGRASDRAPEPGLGADVGAVQVAVEEVLRGTDVLRGLVGHDVSVVTADPDAIESARDLVLFTDCISLGDTAVVREIAWRPASEESVREIREGLEVAAERPLLERVAAADLIVTGTVTRSRPSEEDRTPSSEHDPMWCVATVAVDGVIKGRTRRKEIDVWFADSHDIVWYRSPKLHEGVSGVFLLHSGEDVSLGPEPPPAAYRCVHPLDFHEPERVPHVQRLAGSEAGES